MTTTPQKPGGADPGASPTAASLSELVNDLLERFHQPARSELEQLLALAGTLSANDATMRRVGAALLDFEGDLLDHMLKEERILFPFFLAMDRAREDPTGERVRTHFGTVQNPIGVMLADHVRSSEALKLLARLGAELRSESAGAEESRAFAERLEAFAEQMREHVRIEEQVIFPMAIQLERRLGWHVF